MSFPNNDNMVRLNLLKIHPLMIFSFLFLKQIHSISTCGYTIGTSITAMTTTICYISTCACTYLQLNCGVCLWQITKYPDPEPLIYGLKDFSLRPWKQQLVKKYLVNNNLSNEWLNNKIIKYWSFINISWTTLIFCEFHCWVDWNLIYIKVQFMYLLQLYWKNDWLKSNTHES